MSNDFIHTKNPSDIVSLTYAGVSTRKTDNGFFFSLALQTKTKVKYLYVYFQHLIYSDRLIALNKHSIKQRFFFLLRRYILIFLLVFSEIYYLYHQIRHSRLVLSIRKDRKKNERHRDIILLRVFVFFLSLCTI